MIDFRPILGRSFPQSYLHDTSVVAQSLPSGAEISDSFCRYNLLSGETISFPYRVYGVETVEPPLEFTPIQKMIFHAFLSRSANGYVREKHIRKILDQPYPEWVFPYIVKLSDEYVVEILECIYSDLSGKDCQKIREFCQLNVVSFVRSYDRMVSYWWEYYGGPFDQYVGAKLFRECYGYRRALWNHLPESSFCPQSTMNDCCHIPQVQIETQQTYHIF